MIGSPNKPQKEIKENWTRLRNKLRIRKHKRVALYDNDGFAASKNLMKYINEEKGGFKLKSSKTYYIDILQKLEHSELNKEKLKIFHKGDLNSYDDKALSDINALPYEIHLSSKSNDVNIPSSMQVAVGEYDRIRYLIKLNSVKVTSDILLELRAIRKNEGPYNQPFFLPVIIKARKARRTLSTVMFFLIAIITGGIDDSAPFLNSKLGIVLSQEYINFIQVGGMFAILVCISILIYKTDITKFN